MRIQTKRLLLNLSDRARPDARKFKVTHNRGVHTVYVQILRFETVVWYR